MDIVAEIIGKSMITTLVKSIYHIHGLRYRDDDARRRLCVIKLDEGLHENMVNEDSMATTLIIAMGMH